MFRHCLCTGNRHAHLLLRFLFNVLVMDGLVYVCMTRSSEQAKKRTIFAFLDDIKVPIPPSIICLLPLYIPRSTSASSTRSTLTRLCRSGLATLTPSLPPPSKIAWCYINAICNSSRTCGVNHFFQTYYSQDPALDKVSQVQGQIQDVKGIMVENVGTTWQANQKYA